MHKELQYQQDYDEIDLMEIVRVLLRSWCFFPHKMTEDFSQFLSAKEEKAA